MVEIGYKKLTVYQKALSLTIKTIQYFSGLKITRNYDFLINQLFRSISSIGANIAEGYGLGQTKNYKRHLKISRGSSFETQYWLDLAIKLNIFDNKKLESYLSETVEISKILTVIIRKLN